MKGGHPRPGLHKVVWKLDALCRWRGAGPACIAWCSTWTERSSRQSVRRRGPIPWCRTQVVEPQRFGDEDEELGKKKGRQDRRLASWPVISTGFYAQSSELFRQALGALAFFFTLLYDFQVGGKTIAVRTKDL